MLKRITKFAAVISFSLLMVAQEVYAQNTGTIQVPNPSRYGSLEEIINVLGGLVRPIVILALIVMLMYGGWVRLTARDDSKKVEASSKIITAAIVGFGIIVLAPVIVRFVGSLLGVQGGILDLGS